MSLWALFALVFAGLAFARLYNLEELFRHDLRSWLRESGAYAARRQYQTPLAIGLGIVASGFLGWVLLKWKRAYRRRDKALFAAGFAMAAMASLIALRTVSLSAFDKLLYGPVKLNWVVDTGSSLLVLCAAIYYVWVVSGLTGFRNNERPQ